MEGMDLLFAESSIKGWGTEQHFAALAIAMARRSHNVRCLMRAGSPLERVLREANIPVVALEFRGVADPRLLWALMRMVLRRRPDWLITNDGKFYWSFVLFSAISRARTALFRHWPNMPKKKLTRRLITHYADRFIVVSQFQRAHLQREGIDVRRMSVLYNPIDTEALRPSPQARARMRESLSIASSDVLIGYVGRMIAEKGVFCLFEASERVLAAAPQTRLLWVGDGADLAELRARVERSVHRARHTFISWTANVRDIYVSLDIAVVPSQYPDPCPRVPVEAQACGVPVVCSKAGGLPETFVPEVSGLLTEPESVASLGEAILSLAHDPQRRAQMGAAGREWVCSKLSFDRVAQDFEALLSAPDSAVPPQLSGSSVPTRGAGSAAREATD